MAKRTTASIFCAFVCAAFGAASAKPPGTPINEKVNCEERSAGRLPYDPTPPHTPLHAPYIDTTAQSFEMEITNGVIDPIYPMVSELLRVYGKGVLNWFAGFTESQSTEEVCEPPSSALTYSPICPYLQQKSATPVQPACTECLSADIFENLNKLEKAQKLQRQAEFYRRTGHPEAARHCYKQMRRLCPGSRFDQLAQDGLAALVPQTRHDANFACAEEQEADDDSECCEHEKQCAHAAILNRLQKKVSISFQNTPLAGALEEISDLCGINIVIDRKVLEEEGIKVDRPLTMKMQAATLSAALKVLVEQVGLSFVVKDEVVLVTTPARARGKLMQKVYPVKDLIEATTKRSRKEAQANAPSADQLLIMCITNTLAPQSWSVMGGSGAIEYFAGSHALVVNQTVDVHEQITEFLEALRRLHAAQSDDSAEDQETKLQAALPRNEAHVAELLVSCQRALTNGCYAQAEQLADKAQQLDPACVAAKALIHKTRLLLESQQERATPISTVRFTATGTEETMQPAHGLVLEAVHRMPAVFTVHLEESNPAEQYHDDRQQLLRWINGVSAGDQRAIFEFFVGMYR